MHVNNDDYLTSASYAESQRRCLHVREQTVSQIIAQSTGLRSANTSARF